MSFTTLPEAIDWLYSTQMFGIKLGLDNITRLLNESLSFPSAKTKVVQIVGTNGKGSTSAFLESVARAHGIRTGLFTSPHLITFNERTRVNGLNIPDEDLLTLLNFFKDLVADWDPHPTFFELSLAIAMKYFKDRECELIILEAGMGGRLDATSAVPKDVAVITPIGLDHQEYLGDTLADIAGEKGAIMRPNVPCITAPQEPAAIQTLHQIASETRCDLTTIRNPIEGYHLGLQGEHQKWNAALAIEALCAIKPDLNYASVAEGLQTVSWPGRFQELNIEDHLVILDCSHNVPAITALINQWQARFGQTKAHLIFGAARDKNIEGVLTLLLPLCQSVEVYQLKNPRAESTANLASLVRQLSPELPCRELDSLDSATIQPHTLITGSVFLAGETLEHFSKKH